MTSGRSGSRFKGALGAAVFGAAFIAIVSAGAWLFYRASKRELISQVASRLSAIADIKTEQLTVWREDMLHAGASLQSGPLNTLAIAPFLDGQGSPQLEKSLRSWLDGLRHGYDALGVVLLDPHGAVRLGVGASSGKVGGPGKVSARAALNGRRPFLSDIHRGERFEDAHLDLAVPLEAASGAYVGTLLFHLPAERFIDPVTQQWPGASDSAECVLVRPEGDGYVVLNELRFKEGSVLGSRGPLFDDASPAARAARGSEGFMRGRDYRGERVFAETRNVRDTGWRLVAKIDEEEVFHPLKFSVGLILGGLGMVTLTTVLGLLYWSGRRDAETLARELAAERERLEIAERYAALSRQANDAIFMVDEWMRIVEANDRATDFFAYQREEFLAMKLDQLDAGDGALLSRKVEPGRGLVFETSYRRKDGSLLPVEVSVSQVEVEGKHLYMALVRDASELRRSESERKRVESQLQQVQRLETVGRLAGGVAHDFNNILTALLGHCSLLKDSFEPGDARLADLGEIEAAGLRAAGLTRQLLAFSRRQRVAPQPTDLNAVILGLQSMLRRLIGEDIRISLALCEPPWTVLVDPGQVEQILLNLAVNSRDAMPRGGEVSIATVNELLSKPLMTRHGDIAPGRYLRLTVKDDGEGMSPQTLEHLFEPFFTTKVQGKGTGLGLATVYGIVQQSGGAISVESTPGAGSAFIVRFPAVDAAAAPKPDPAPAPPVHAGGTILLVEDEEAVRRLVERVLSKDGYKVAAFPGGSAARDLFLKDPAAFDLLLTDLVMPGMDGVALAKALRAARPGLPVIFMSGYDDPERVDILNLGERFLQKPLTSADLLAAVAAALARPPA